MNFFEKVYCKFFDRAYMTQKVSYSQCGEDLIVDFLLTWILKIEKPTFMDIGAHHPWSLNNTMLFYKRGLRGVNIEPDPALFGNFLKYRSRDININKGIGIHQHREFSDFYIMSYPALNTFSKEEAEKIARAGNVKINTVKQVELISINGLLSKHYSNRALDFLSIDVEGLDLGILKSIAFEKYKINVICVETVEYLNGNDAKKKKSIKEFLFSEGYKAYAETPINTIFVRKEI